MEKGIFGNVFKFLFYLACAIGIVIVSIWSYTQTQQFYSPYDALSNFGNETVSNALSLITQYGQNLALFIVLIESGRRIAYQNKIVKLNREKPNSFQNQIIILEEEINKSRKLTIGAYSLFVIFAGIDAGTNIGEFEKTIVPQAVASFENSSFGLNIFIWGGRILSIAIVFIEELFLHAVNAVSHSFNDILESLEIKRIDALDLFTDPDKVIATRMEEKIGKGSSTSVVSKTSEQNQNRQPVSQNNPQQRPNQTFHTPQNRPNQNHQNRPNQSGGIRGLMGMMGEVNENINSQSRISKPTPFLENISVPTLWEMVQEGKITEKQLEMELDRRSKSSFSERENRENHEERYR